MDSRTVVCCILHRRSYPSIPIHYNDYEIFKSPLEDFKRTVAEAGLKDRVHYLGHGDTYEFEVPGARDGT